MRPLVSILRGEGDRRETIAIAAIGLLLVANLIHGSRILVSLWGDAFRASFVVQAGLIAAYTIVAIKRRDLLLVSAAAAILLGLILSHLLFAARAHAPVNLNVVLTYLPLLAFVPLYEAETSIQRMLSLMLGLSIAYLLFYTLGSRYLAAAGSGSLAVLGAHDGDGSRVYLAIGPAGFVAFYALAARHWHIVTRLALILLGASAFWLSGGRTVTLMFALVFVLAAARLLVAPVRIALFAGVMTCVGLLLLGLFVPGWNPFQYMIWDDSAYARANEYAIAIPQAARHFLIGVGTPGVPADYQHYVGSPRFEPLYGSDLGALGPLLDFGVIGFGCFLMALYKSIVPEPPIARADVTALKLTCMMMAVEGIISPLLVFDAGSIFFWLLMATAWRRNRARRLEREAAA